MRATTVRVAAKNSPKAKPSVVTMPGVGSGGAAAVGDARVVAEQIADRGRQRGGGCGGSSVWRPPEATTR
ncbi:hypothetical protein, partial [Actinomadura formosensis]